MPALITLALDVMGGDLGPQSALEGARLALQSHPNLHLRLVGDEAPISAFIDKASPAIKNRVALIAADSVIAMTDSPRDALRNGAQSSMRLAVECVQQGVAEACVSSGNTGALVAISKFVLKTIEGLRRPALLTSIPASNGVTLMLDVGANTQCTANMLAEFAVMGSIVSSTDYNVESPKVGLLNIGVEAGKGHEYLQEADEILTASSLNYVGFCEANQFFSSEVDVMVSDGFTGNIALKTMEGFSHFMSSHFKSGALSLSGLDPRVHNGASLVGLRNVVIKSHGGADAVALSHAIETAMVEARAHVPIKIAAGIAHLQLQ